MNPNRLLTIDDEIAISHAVERVARGRGYDVVATSDPADFLAKLGDWKPTHILLDLQMPRVDGIEMLRHLAARETPAKIVIASGVEGRIIEAARRLGLERGLDIAATLMKPFRSAELRQVLDDLAICDNLSSPAALAGAIERDGLFLAYQPKVALATGKVVGFEALVRWQHDRLGTIFPDRFVPLAEGAGLIDRLTEAVIGIGLQQVAIWGAAGDTSLAVNIAAANLRDLAFADRLEQRCANAGVAPDRLVLELTETGAMSDPVGAMDVLTRLRLKGARLSIDDFGTGYSSLAQLVRLPFSELKIDKSFVIACDTSTEARVVVKSTIDLAHNLGLSAVAEGVETEAIVRLLHGLGCDVVQGYYIAKPLAAADVADWLASWARRWPALLATSAASGAASPETRGAG